MMVPAAHIVHRLRGRLRLKVPDKRRDADWLTEAASRLERMPGVRRVETRIISGSLLIYHQAGTALEERLASVDSFRITNASIATPPVLDPALDGLSRSQRKLKRRTGGRVNLETLLIALLVLAALGQALRGQIMVPAVSLLWYAAQLAFAVKHWERDSE